MRNSEFQTNSWSLGFCQKDHQTFEPHLAVVPSTVLGHFLVVLSFVPNGALT